jgi:anti-anti-sigma factor
MQCRNFQKYHPQAAPKPADKQSEVAGTMTIASSLAGNKALVRVAGRMNAIAAPQFERTCNQLIDMGIERLIVDLADLEYISSPGLRAVLAAGERTRLCGGSLVLCHPRGIVKNALQLTGFCSLFPVYDSVETALAQLP